MLRQEFSLQDRYQRETGVIFISGIQALVRMAMQQRGWDMAQGLNTGGFISGYRGSPLGGLDRELWRQQQRLDELNIRFQPGVNEELAATAVWGTQQVGLFPKANVDGVFGLWYGKAPGLDRAGDAIRHANAAGTSANGGVLLVVGDDHGCKSSTLPSHSELTLKDLGIPILNPADVQDVLDFGLFGWQLSRYAGCWAGMVALADTMDSAATVLLQPDRRFLRPEHNADVHIAAGRAALEQEALLHEIKLPLAVDFARGNRINKLVSPAPRASLGVVTTGKAYLDTRQALFELGIADEQAMASAGLRLLKLGMSWPLDPVEVREFARGLDTIVVIEEKRAFVEDELKTLLYGADAPRVVGKSDSDGQPLLSRTGELNAASVAQALARYLPNVPNDAYLRQLESQAGMLVPIAGQAKTDRLPMFCAGCPHNTSTNVPEGSRASAGIGCHYMAQWMDRETTTYTQMGGEGVNWTGQAPFTDEDHIFVNLGDGTYFHSGLLAVRQSVAAGVNVTYKILYNDAVAMTGGQPVDGALSVAEMVAQLQAEGVRDIRVVSDNPDAHTGLDVPVEHRDALETVQKQIREVAGCTAIIYQQTCATELRRRRKRGLAADPDVRVMINDAVCEGCGDCSVQSNCVAVEPLATDFGTKRKINQTACNKDLSCVKGFCPAFVMISGGTLKSSGALEMDLDTLRGAAPLPEPVASGRAVNLLVAGVGGTGVVTVSALLGTAAHLDGKAASTLDMMGLAQKGGAVFGHIRIADDATHLHGTRVAAGKADLLLACDLIAGASKDALTLLSPEHTQVVVNTKVMPTAQFVLHQDSDVDAAGRLQRLAGFSDSVVRVDAARLVARLLGDTSTLNVFLLGFAYQHGSIPLSLQALERAIEINGVAVTANLNAFHLGRLAAHDESALALNGVEERGEAMDPAGQDDIDSIIERRRAHLIDYQGPELAERYVGLVARIRAAEQALEQAGAEGSREPTDQVPLSRAVAQSYAKLLAYKDEYEVARLYTDGRWREKLEQRFGGDFKLTYLMAPPLLGAAKRKFGGWMTGAFKLLARLKGLRGTAFDPFGYSAERREERWLIEHFEAVVDELIENLAADNIALAARIAELPLAARGYGHVKRAAMARMLETERELLEAFHRPPEPVTIFDPQAPDRHAA
ncbi:MAG: indolepyruvate ferredoxin oxidoreductase family protein [Gammaproteobacteria bacterium]|nr:indolepyruvate ferredoxin oxidoreductase family protein [Gammaproteobacteria bacterium]